MSENYAASGVDIAAGDAASHIAATAAKTTFAGRIGMIGQPVNLPGGFAGVLDFGEFYLVQCCDTVGTKIDLATRLADYSALGNDLLAMVADDAVCLGAETVSITNTFETQKINSQNIGIMMESLAAACREQKIVISGGEIAEVGEKITGTSWGADAIGIVKKDRIITGENVRVGDALIALQEDGFRCNGYSLVRKILRDKAPDNTALAKDCLRGSLVYHNAILAVHGRFDESPKAIINGIAHITGGGIPGNVKRILKKPGFGARFTHLFSPPEVMQKLKKLGAISTEEFFEVWNGGNGMILACPPSEAEKIVSILKANGKRAQLAGEVTNTGTIEIDAWNGENVVYQISP